MVGRRGEESVKGRCGAVANNTDDRLGRRRRVKWIRAG